MRKLVLLGLAALLLSVPSAVGATAPPAPANLVVTGTTETTITLAWGPTQVADFQAYDAPKKNQLIVGWSASTDTRGPVTYTVTKDGSQIATGYAGTEITLTGIGPKVRSFRICVTPSSIAGSGPVNCSTFTRV